MASKRRKERRRLEQLKALLGIAEEFAAQPQAVDEPTLIEAVSRETPAMVERAKAEAEQHGATYEEANWAKLSPAFRAAHNRLRRLRGMAAIPAPAIDLYRPPVIRRADPKELEALDQEAKAVGAQFMTNGGKVPTRLMAPEHEGFSINDTPEKY